MTYDHMIIQKVKDWWLDASDLNHYAETGWLLISALPFEDNTIQYIFRKEIEEYVRKGPLA